jgi:Tol biopolymer transport system component
MAMSRYRWGAAVLAAVLLAGCTDEGGAATPTPSPASPGVTPSTSPGGFEPDPAAATLGEAAPVVLLKLGPTGLYLHNLEDSSEVRIDDTTVGAPGYQLTVDGDVTWDGSQVAFDSAAEDIIFSDTNGYIDVFLQQVATGSVYRVSEVAGVEWNEGSFGPRISADGSTIVFMSFATNLDPGVTTVPHVYRYDIAAGELKLVSVGPDGGQPWASDPSVSAGGRYIAFAASTQGEYGDDNFYGDVFVLDTTTGFVEQVSVATDGTPGDFISGHPSISLDGRLIAFESKASNFVVGDTNAFSNIYVRDRVTGETTLISKNASGGPGNNDSVGPAILGDGSGVVFWSYASDLLPGDTNGDYDVFYADLATGAIERINVGPGGVEANGFSMLEGVYGSRYVVFMTDATNLGGEGDDGPHYWYGYDLETGDLTKFR